MKVVRTLSPLLGVQSLVKTSHTQRNHMSSHHVSEQWSRMELQMPHDIQVVEGRDGSSLLRARRPGFEGHDCVFGARAIGLLMGGGEWWAFILSGALVKQHLNYPEKKCPWDHRDQQDNNWYQSQIIFFPFYREHS